MAVIGSTRELRVTRWPGGNRGGEEHADEFMVALIQSQENCVYGSTESLFGVSQAGRGVLKWNGGSEDVTWV